VLDRFDDAEGHFDRARQVSMRVGSPSHVAHVDRDCADVYLRRDGPGDRERAVAALQRARDAYRELGAPNQVTRIDARLAELAESGPPPDVAGDNTFRREGDVWHLTFAGRHAVMRDAKGLRDLAHLLALPGEAVSSAELAGATAGERAADDRDRGAEVLDARARAEYRARLVELEDDLRDAEDAHDLARAERTRTERDFLATELASALGLGGRSRRLGDVGERARKAVSARIGMTLGRMQEIHPELAAHLQSSVRTGLFCVYAPTEPAAWRF
jgi:hypothetical protein